MNTLQAAEAKQNWGNLLLRADRGQSTLIKRRDHEVAVLVPMEEFRRPKIAFSSRIRQKVLDLWWTEEEKSARDLFLKIVDECVESPKEDRP